MATLGAAVGITVVVTKVMDKLKNADLGGINYTPGSPFGPYSPMSQSRVRQVQSNSGDKPSENVSHSADKTDAPVKKGDYSHLEEPQKVGEGFETTRAQRKRILKENERQNGGEVMEMAAL